MRSWSRWPSKKHKRTIMVREVNKIFLKARIRNGLECKKLSTKVSYGMTEEMCQEVQKPSMIESRILLDTTILLAQNLSIKR